MKLGFNAVKNIAIRILVHEHESRISRLTLTLNRDLESMQEEVGFAIRISGKLSLRSHRFPLSNHHCT